MDKEDSCCVVNTEDTSRKHYWDANFEKVNTPNWVETSEPWIMPWVDKAALPLDSAIFCAGVGDSNIVETLIRRGFTNIIANDISEVALQKLEAKHPEAEVTYLLDDLIKPTKLQTYEGQIDLYIDRATLHFFTTCPEKDHYFQQMKNLLRPQGYAMLGVFSKDNVAKCCGLDLQLWSLQSLQNRMSDYNHLDSNEVPFIELNGNTRNYIYQFSQKNL
jgi:SAM-dependent methyltransferase